MQLNVLDQRLRNGANRRRNQTEDSTSADEDVIAESTQPPQPSSNRGSGALGRLARSARILGSWVRSGDNNEIRGRGRGREGSDDGVGAAERAESFLEKFGMGRTGDPNALKCEAAGSCDVKPSSRPPVAEEAGSREAETSQRRRGSLCRRITRKVSNFVLDTSSSAYYRWLGVLCLAVSYNYIFIVLRGVYTRVQQRHLFAWLAMDCVCDCLYLADIYVGAHTGYLEEGLPVTDQRRLLRRYLSQPSTKLDILSVLPTDLLYLVPSITSAGVCVRFNRLLKVRRVLEFFDRTETRTSWPNLFRVLQLVLYILVIIHWNACLFFAISKALGLGSDAWVYPPRGEACQLAPTEAYNYSTEWEDFHREYIYSFYWSALTLTTIGETPHPVLNVEYAFVTADFLVGVLVFATIVGNVGSMIANMNAARSDFQQKMDGVKRYMEFRHVGKELERRVIRWFDYHWCNKQSLDEGAILASLPDKLRAEIAIHVHFDTLRRVAIFRDCEPGLLIELLLKLRLQVFSPGDYICRQGDIGKEMYIVKRGRLSVVAQDGKTVFATLREGCVFGEVSLLNIPGNKTGNRRTANVRSQGYSDLFCLSKRDLWAALDEYPEARRRLIQRGRDVLRKDNLLDEAAVRRAEETQESQAQQLERLADSVGCLHTRLARLAAEFGAGQARLKRRLTRLEAAAAAETGSAGSTSSEGLDRLPSPPPPPLPPPPQQSPSIVDSDSDTGHT